MIWRDERGSASITLVSAWTVIMLCIAFGADLGRVYTIREQLRTAEDAASLAGALQLQHWVKMQFRREVKVTRWICDEEGNLPGEVPGETPEGEPPVDLTAKCTEEEWASDEPLIMEGPETELWPEVTSSWRARCGGGKQRCFPEAPLAFQCWITPRKGTEEITARARAIFEANEVWGSQATRKGLRVQVKGLEQPRPTLVKVEVDGQLELKTFLLGIIGIDSLPVITPEAGVGVLVRRGASVTTTVTNASGSLVTLISPCDPQG